MGPSIRNSSRVFLFIIVLFANSGDDFAQNAIEPSIGWYCDQRWTEGHSVLIGTVTRILSPKNLSREKTRRLKAVGKASIRDLIRFNVDKTYRGGLYNRKPTEILVPNLVFDGVPARDFRVGEKYLLYLEAITAGKGEVLSYYIGPDSRTAPVADAADTVAFLESSSKRNFMLDALGYDAKDESIGGLIGGRAISNPKPAYPEDAKKLRWSGRVRVAVLVDESGHVIKARALCVTLESVARASETAALGSRFMPVLVSGKPIRARGEITYNFVP